MELFRQELREHPERITQEIRRNRRELLLGFAGETTGLVDNTTAYLSTQVPFGQAKSVAYVAFAAASIFDLMERRRFQMAEAQLGLLLCAVEQAALREWRWNHAWLLTH